MVRHFLQLPYMVKACHDWENDYPTDSPATWFEFKQFFTKKFFNYQNHEASLNNAGVANSVISNTAAVDSIYAELTALRAATKTKDEQLSLLVEHLQQSVITPPTLSDSVSLPSIVTNPTITHPVPDMSTMIQQCVAQVLVAQNLVAPPAPAPAPRSNNRCNNQRQPKPTRTTPPLHRLKLLLNSWL